MHYFLQVYIARHREFYSLTLLFNQKSVERLGLIFPFTDKASKHNSFFRILTVKRKRLIDCIRIMESEMPHIDEAVRKNGTISIINNIFGDYIRSKENGKKIGLNVYPTTLDDTRDGPGVYVMLAKYLNNMPSRIREDSFQYYNPAIGITPLTASKYEPGDYMCETIPLPALDVNPNLLDGVKYFRNRYVQALPCDSILDLAEQMALIDMAENTPIDANMWPLDLNPLEITPALVASVGPKATSGGIDREGKTVLKTNCYYDSVTGFLDIVELAKRDVAMPIPSLIWSFKNESIKHGKKLRLFTVTQFITNIGEQLVFGPMLNASKNTVITDTGGSRIMNGATLDRGFGAVLLDKMLKRNGISEGVTSEEELYSVNTDYSFYEYQHHVKQIVIARSSYYYMYNNNVLDPMQKLYIKLQAWLQETYIQIDVDMGSRQILHFRPGAFGSGILLTLDSNGKINKTNLRLGAYSIVQRTENFDGVKKACNNTVVQGDDGYIAGRMNVIEGMKEIVKELTKKYSNDIKIADGPLYSKFDSYCYNSNHARDFLKLVPVKTKKGVFFIRPTEDALVRLVMPNNPGFNAATQYHSSLSQMMQSAGNRVTFDIAKGKHDLIVEFMKKEKLKVTNADKEESLKQLTKLHKGDAIIDFLTLTGFQELTFAEINKKFLDHDIVQTYKNIKSASYYQIYHINDDYYMNVLCNTVDMS